MENKTFLIFGISRGLGKEITKNIPKPTDIVYGVSRTKPDYLEQKNNIQWIQADLSRPEQAVSAIKLTVTSDRIDYLIYNVGIWEADAFTDAYDFSKCTASEIHTLINTNITSCLLAIQACLENLKKSSNAKIILIGSTWGVDNHNGKEVAFSATKFALRGIVHSLREHLREQNIGVSIINLGYLATEFEGENDIQTIAEKTNATLIPLQDVLSAILFILSTSPYSCVKEITMPAMKDTNV